MPLPMQGNELLPRGQYIIGRGLRPRAPDRWGGDGLADAPGDLGQSAPAKFGDDRFPVRRSVMGKNVEQRGFDLRRLGVTEIEPGELFEMLVQEPGVTDDRLEDQRLAARNGGAVAAMDRARGKLRARDHIALAARRGKRANGEWRMAHVG